MERKVSFLVPAYNEEESVAELCAKLTAIAAACRERGMFSAHEILFIDDGSTDHTLENIRRLHEKDPAVRYISFRKNFGKSTALQTGFRNCTGDIVITMDADLQDEPEEIPHFIEKLDEGYDVVSGWKVDRLDPAEKRLPSRLFNAVTARMSGLPLHDFDCGYKAYRREAVEAIDVYGSMHRYLPVLAWRHGFRIAELPVRHNRRKYGRSKYGLERYLQGLFDFVTVYYLTRYADRPMYFFGRLGLLSGGAGTLICLYLVILKCMGEAIGGRPLLTLGVLLMMVGIQFLSIGFIGNMLVDQHVHANYTEHRIRERSTETKQ